MQRKKILLLGGLFICGLNLYGQRAPSSAGGEAESLSGTVSYSVGQLFTDATTHATGSITEGVQQPFEITVITATNKPEINYVQADVFPNPTTGVAILQIDQANSGTLIAEIYNQQGVFIHESLILETKNTIHMENYPNGLYLIRVKEKNQLLKVLKIIKN